MAGHLPGRALPRLRRTSSAPRRTASPARAWHAPGWNGAQGAAHAWEDRLRRRPWPLRRQMASTQFVIWHAVTCVHGPRAAHDGLEPRQLALPALPTAPCIRRARGRGRRAAAQAAAPPGRREPGQRRSTRLQCQPRTTTTSGLFACIRCLSQGLGFGERKSGTASLASGGQPSPRRAVRCRTGARKGAMPFGLLARRRRTPRRADSPLPEPAPGGYCMRPCVSARCPGLVLLHHVGRDAAALTDRQAMLFRPGPDITASAAG